MRAPARARRRQRAPAEQRVDVVGVDDVVRASCAPPEPSSGVEPAEQHPPRRPAAPGVGARALEQLDRVPAALAAAPRSSPTARSSPPCGAIAVVQQQDAHRRGDSANVPHRMAIALLTNYLAPYRIPLYERLAERYGVEVLCFGGGERYVPGLVRRSRRPARGARPFPARRLHGPREALTVGAPLRRGDRAVRGRRDPPRRLRRRAAAAAPFVLWASVWAPAALARPPARAPGRPATSTATPTR